MDTSTDGARPAARGDGGNVHGNDDDLDGNDVDDDDGLAPLRPTGEYDDTYDDAFVPDVLSATLGVEDALACLVTTATQSPTVVAAGPPSPPAVTAAGMACSKDAALAAAAASAAAAANSAAAAGAAAGGATPPPTLPLRVRWATPPRAVTARFNFVLTLGAPLACARATAAALTLVTTDGLGRGAGGGWAPPGTPAAPPSAGAPAASAAASAAAAASSTESPTAAARRLLAAATAASRAARHAPGVSLEALLLPALFGGTPAGAAADGRGGEALAVAANAGVPVAAAGGSAAAAPVAPTANGHAPAVPAAAAAPPPPPPPPPLLAPLTPPGRRPPPRPTDIVARLLVLRPPSAVAAAAAAGAPSPPGTPLALSFAAADAVAGAAVARVPLAHPRQVPVVAALLRQQAAYNELFVSCFVPTPGVVAAPQIGRAHV